jgi:hypothetical protein
VEYQSPFRHGDLLFVWINMLLGGGLLFTYFLSRSYRSFTWSLTIVGLLFVGVTTLRTTGYIALIGLPIILYLLQYQGQTLLPKRGGLYVRGFLVAGVLGMISAFLLAGESDQLTGFSEQQFGIGPIRKFSTDVPQYVLDQYPDTRTFNGYSVGSYLIWRWWPSKKVFQDTKISAYQPRFQLLRTVLSPEELLDRYELRLAVLERVNPLTQDFFLPQAGWESIRMDEGLILFHHGEVDGGE